MPGKIPPQDYDPEAGDLIGFRGVVPDSPEWYGNLRGAILSLTSGYDTSFEGSEVAKQLGGEVVDSLEIGAFSSDHGELSGLEDDDHGQYHNDARGDTRYYTKSLIDAHYPRYIGEYGHGYYSGEQTVNGTGAWRVLTISSMLSYGNFSLGSNAIRVGRGGHYRVSGFVWIRTVFSPVYIVVGARYNNVQGGRTAQYYVAHNVDATYDLPSYTLYLAEGSEVGLSVLITAGAGHKAKIDNAQGALTLERVL